jgi:hypothetical protein
LTRLSSEQEGISDDPSNPLIRIPGSLHCKCHSRCHLHSMVEEPQRPQRQSWLGEKHKNLTKIGMDSILKSLYNHYKDMTYSVPFLWFSKQVTTRILIWGGFEFCCYLCLLCGFFDGANLTFFFKRFAYTCLPVHPRSKSFLPWTLYFLWAFSGQPLWKNHLLSSVNLPWTKIHTHPTPGYLLYFPGPIPCLFMTSERFQYAYFICRKTKCNQM